MYVTLVRSWEWRVGGEEGNGEGGEKGRGFGGEVRGIKRGGWVRVGWRKRGGGG